MKLIKLINIFFLMILILMSFSGCVKTSKSNKSTSNSNEKIEEVKEEINETIGNKYIINTTLFQIIELSTKEQPFGPYYYKIFTSKRVFAEDIVKREPKISDIDDGIIRLFQAAGSNAFFIQYFDVWKERISKPFSIYSTYADYVDPQTKECLIAYFDNTLPLRRKGVNH